MKMILTLALALLALSHSAEAAPKQLPKCSQGFCVGEKVLWLGRGVFAIEKIFANGVLEVNNTGGKDYIRPEDAKRKLTNSCNRGICLGDEVYYRGRGAFIVEGLYEDDNVALRGDRFELGTIDDLSRREAQLESSLTDDGRESSIAL